MGHERVVEYTTDVIIVKIPESRVRAIPAAQIGGCGNHTNRSIHAIHSQTGLPFFSPMEVP